MGKGLHPGCGVLSSPTYLFSDGFWEGLTTGAVRKGWEGGNEGGREGRRAPGYRSGELAGSGRREGRRLSWAQPALRVEDPPRLEPPCSVRPGSPGFRGEREGRGGCGFCQTRAPGAAWLGSCPGRGAEYTLRGPIQPSALCQGSLLSCHRGSRWGTGAPGGSPRLRTWGRVLPDAGTRPSWVSRCCGREVYPREVLFLSSTHCLWAWSRRGRGQRGEHGYGGAIFVWFPAPCASLSQPQETFSELTGRPHLTSTLKSPSWPRDPCRSPPSFPSLSSQACSPKGAEPVRTWC